LIWTGKLGAVFNQAEKIESLDFHTFNHEQYVSRNVLVDTFKPMSPQKQSPRMSKKMAPNRAQAKGQPDGSESDLMLNMRDLPSAPIVPWGVTIPILKYLEISETLSNMQELMIFQQQHPELKPSQALEALVASYPQREQQPGFQGPNQQPGHPGQMMQRPQMGMPPNQNPALQQQQAHAHAQQGQMNGPPAARTPGGGPYMAAPYGASPHMANLGLPNAMNGSPHMGTPMGVPGGSVGAHTPSPATSHMQAPGMVSQHSQQGTPIATGTAGASPNISNKRRRSTVKAEEDGDVNGVAPARVKQSPRVPSNKKLKNNPS
jgi:hypothetical protein